MSKLRDVDFTTKIILILVVFVISFLVLFLVLSTHIQDTRFSTGMMGGMLGSNQDYTVSIVISLAVALLSGVLILLLLKPQLPETAVTKPVANIDELEIIKRALSDDEKAVIDEIRKAGEITQDSLRFRLEWSKAKLSRILTNLDKLNIIQRERLGKTYKVFLAKDQSEQ